MKPEAELIFASNNSHKLKEVQFIINAKIKILPLSAAGIYTDIPENEETIAGNALAKAQFVNRLSQRNCFADDTGLEVDALNGAPGVHSARYAGEPANAQKNIEKLLREMRNRSNRKASFKTVLALILQGKEHIFEGIVEGEIAQEQKGNGGFGYDPVFIPDGYKITFAEMAPTIKNRISHRARAIEKMKQFLASDF